MGAGGRRQVLDEIKKREILALVTVGCSRRTAARYVGCSPQTIQRTADRQREFAEQLRKAESKVEIGYLKNIQAAAKKEQYWRAAAWALERRNPEDFAARRPEVITIDQIKTLIAQFAQIIVAEVPVARFRKSIIKKLEAIAAGLGVAAPEANQSHEPESP